MSEPHKRQIVGAGKRTHKGDVDIDLLQFAYFSDLVAVISRGAIRKRLEPELGWRLEEHRDGVVELRNAASHPVKPVLASASELPDLVRCCAHLHDMIKAADKLLCGGDDESTTRDESSRKGCRQRLEMSDR